MRKFSFFIFSIFIVHTSGAETVNIDWMNGSSLYDTSSCNVGDDLILPTPTPTKHGYTFLGWGYGVINGNCTQSGTPTPTNPIEPTCVYLGNTVLRAVGSGGDMIADSYDSETRTITRRIGVRLLDGTEDWSIESGCFRYTISDKVSGKVVMSCSHFEYTSKISTNTQDGQFGTPNISNSLYFKATAFADLTAWTTFLAEQYDAGTPVTIYYPLATPVEEELGSISQ